MQEFKTLSLLGCIGLCLLYAPLAFGERSLQEAARRLEIVTGRYGSNIRGSAAPGVRDGDNRPDLALQIARVSANEGALRYRVTTALVWQVVRENGGKTFSQMSRFLTRHSPRVAKIRKCRIGNCFWSPNLKRNNEKPAGLNLENDFWRVHVLPFWKDALAYADWLVSGKRTSDDPCDIQPETWGGDMDRARAIKRGLYPIGCRSMDACTTHSCNDGFTMKAHCWKFVLNTKTWVCDPTLAPAPDVELVTVSGRRAASSLKLALRVH